MPSSRSLRECPICHKKLMNMGQHFLRVHNLDWVTYMIEHKLVRVSVISVE